VQRAGEIHQRRRILLLHENLPACMMTTCRLILRNLLRPAFQTTSRGTGGSRDATAAEGERGARETGSGGAP
jgi:hypothetical protein